MTDHPTDDNRLPPEDADIPDDVPLGDGVDEVWVEDDEWYGSDSHGEFRLRTGSPEPVTEEEVGYRVCNCVVKFTFDRYGERRYCTGYAAGDTCRHHRVRTNENIMKARADKFETGAKAKSHENTFQFMDTHKKIVANDLYKSLIAESDYDFETNIEELEISASDASFVPDDVDTLVLEHPLPNNHEVRCKALWYAALDFVTMESIREEQFRTAFEQSNDPDVAANSVAVGERWQVVASGEEGAVEDKGEHHLNLPLSRISKDYERNLTFGGVHVEDADNDASDMSERDWHLTVEVDEEESAPEATMGIPDESSPLEDVTPDE